MLETYVGHEYAVAMLSRQVVSSKFEKHGKEMVVVQEDFERRQKYPIRPGERRSSLVGRLI